MSYKKLSMQCEKLKSTIEAETARLEKARQDLTNNHAALDGILTDFKKRILNGKRNALNEIESQISDLHKEITRDTTLVNGIEERLPLLQSELEKATSERDNAFASLAVQWLNKEIDAYDHASKMLKESARRLLVCHNLLRETGHQEVYRETLGPAHSYLPSIKPMTIRGFDMSIHMQHGIMKTGGATELQDKVRKEMSSEAG